MSRRLRRQPSRLSPVPPLLSGKPAVPAKGTACAALCGSCRGAGRQASSGVAATVRERLPLPLPLLPLLACAPNRVGVGAPLLPWGVRPASPASAPGVSAPSEMRGESAGAHRLAAPRRVRPTGVPLTAVPGGPPLLDRRLWLWGRSGWLGVKAKPP